VLVAQDDLLCQEHLEELEAQIDRIIAAGRAQDAEERGSV
jgi:hypothetical protein